MVNPGLVAEGTRCGQDMVCSEQSCVALSSLNIPTCPTGSNGQICSGSVSIEGCMGGGAEGLEVLRLGTGGIGLGWGYEPEILKGGLTLVTSYKTEDARGGCAQSA